MPTPSSRISRGTGLSLALPVLSLTLTLCLPAITRGQTWRLAWGDEFGGAKGSAVDRTKWSAEVGGGGWGNKELEFYTDGAKNAYLDGEGHLVIKAVKETLPPEFKCWYGPC